MRKCKRCDVDMMQVGAEHPMMAGGVSTYIRYCHNCGRLEKQSDWTSKPQTILIPKILTEFPEVVTDDRATICEIVSKMLDNPDQHGIYPTTKCFNDLEELIKQIREECKDES